MNLEAEYKKSVLSSTERHNTIKSVKLTPTDAERLKAVAERLGISDSDAIRMSIQYFLNDLKKDGCPYA